MSRLHDRVCHIRVDSEFCLLFYVETGTSARPLLPSLSVGLFLFLAGKRNENSAVHRKWCSAGLLTRFDIHDHRHLTHDTSIQAYQPADSMVFIPRSCSDCWKIMIILEKSTIIFKNTSSVSATDLSHSCMVYSYQY